MPNRRGMSRRGRRGRSKFRNKMGRPARGVGKRTSAFRGPRRMRGGMGGNLPDLPFPNATIVYESGAHNSKSVPYACPNGQTKLTENCTKLTEAQQALIANGSGTKESGNFRMRGWRGRGGRNG